jgi:hypothetical protein
MVIAAAQRRRRRPKSHAAAAADGKNGRTSPPKRIASARMSKYALIAWFNHKLAHFLAQPRIFAFF